LFLLNIALVLSDLQRLFLVCFLCTLFLYFQFQITMVTVIWRTSEGVGDLTIEALRCSLLRFFGSVSCLMLLSLVAIVFMFDFPALPLAFLYSSFVPQIVHSARTGRRKSGDGKFVFLTTINRLFVLFYFFVFLANIFGAWAPFTAIGIAVYSIAQLLVVLLQNWIGPAFFLPEALRTPLFDYGGPVEPGTVCSICMSAIDGDQESMLTPCGHAFHSGCLLRWMQEDMVCPVCREVLPEAVHPEQYGGTFE
jgi:hypothetical protein